VKGWSLLLFNRNWGDFSEAMMALERFVVKGFMGPWWGQPDS
jgi:hypothetical protein